VQGFANLQNTFGRRRVFFEFKVVKNELKMQPFETLHTQKEHFDIDYFSGAKKASSEN